MRGQCSAPTVDETTLARAVDGEVDALGRLLRHFGPIIRNELHIGAQWRPSLEHDDIMQVTYIEVFRQVGRFRANNLAAFETWLRRIAHNNLRDAMRALERDKRPPPARQVRCSDEFDSCAALLELLGATSTTPSRVAIRAEIRGMLESAIEQLPTDYAKVIQLYDLEGQTGPEVAKAMDRSRGAVFLLRMRAHDCLREQLGTASVLISH